VVDFAAAPVANGKLPARGNFRIFVFDGTRYMTAARQVVASATVHQYSLAVPKSRSLSLFLDTRLKVLDQSQTAIASGVKASPVAVGTQPVSVQLTVQ